MPQQQLETSYHMRDDEHLPPLHMGQYWQQAKSLQHMQRQAERGLPPTQAPGSRRALVLCASIRRSGLQCAMSVPLTTLGDSATSSGLACARLKPVTLAQQPLAASSASSTFAAQEPAHISQDCRDGTMCRSEVCAGSARAHTEHTNIPTTCNFYKHDIPAAHFNGQNIPDCARNVTTAASGRQGDFGAPGVRRPCTMSMPCRKTMALAMSVASTSASRRLRLRSRAGRLGACEKRLATMASCRGHPGRLR